MVVASIALLVALGGTSIAAVANVPLLSVGTPQLKSNAVISAKVKNRSLLAVDFKQGQLPRGPQGLRAGPAGPSGPQGPAGVAAPGYVAAVCRRRADHGYDDLDGVRGSRRLVGERHRADRRDREDLRDLQRESACYGAGGPELRSPDRGRRQRAQPRRRHRLRFDSTDDGDEGTSSEESHAIVRRARR